MRKKVTVIAGIFAICMSGLFVNTLHAELIYNRQMKTEPIPTNIILEQGDDKEAGPIDIWCCTRIANGECEAENQHELCAFIGL